jgi:signal transduction histidine kinase
MGGAAAPWKLAPIGDAGNYPAGMIPLSRRLDRWGQVSIGPYSVRDWLPTVLLVPWALIEALGQQADSWPGPTAGVTFFLCVASVLLVERRRRPLTVLAGVCGAVLAPAVLWGSPHATAGVLSMVVAVFACGAHGRRPQSALAMPLGIGTVLIFIAMDPMDSVASSWTWSLNLLWIYGIGAWVRQKQQVAETVGAEAEARAAAVAAEHRLRIARDLHDVLGHSLTVMIVQLQAADEVLASDPARARRALQNAGDTGRNAMAELRTMVDLLRYDRSSQGARSAPGLEQLVSLVTSVRSSGMPVELKLDGDVAGVSETAGRAALRVVQEALTNTLRHAGPVPTTVRVQASEGQLRVQVRNALSDTGVAPRSHGVGEGLKGMRERIEDVGGRLDAGPDGSGGFTVAASLPSTAEALR